MLLICGDSKSVGSNAWTGYLRININALGRPGLHLLSIYNQAVSFQTVAQAVVSTLPLIQALQPSEAFEYACFNWGANEMGDVLPAEATWKANYLAILDGVHTLWPNCACFLTRPWSRGNLTKANTLATWISDIQAARSTFVTQGDDERVWMEGGDDGVTMTTDGVHLSTAGQTGKARAAQIAMGFPDPYP